MSPVSIFLFSLYILIHTGVVTTSDDDPLKAEEKQALLDFFKKVPNRLSWNISEHACSWKGVDCEKDNTTVLFLTLPAKSLVGTIPPNTLGKLTNLRVLSLRINNLTGTIPSDFSNLISLTRLSLQNNTFTGQLPYIDAQRLASFNVSINKLNTSIPFIFSKFDNSSFSMNIYTCGPPTNNTCNDSYLNPNYIYHNEKEHNSKREYEMIGISVGSGLVLLLLLCCVRKKMYTQRKHITKLPPSKHGEGKKLVLFGDYGFGLEDLFKASAEVLGEGSVGMSYKQVLEEGRKTVVVKRLKDVVVTEIEFERIMEGLGRMKDKNVVPLRGYYFSQHEKLLVYDYMPDGSLSLHLHGRTGSRTTHLDWDHRMKIALSAAKGLAYLHIAKKVVHGNIKSSNILIRQESNNEASVSDYGLNTLFGKSSSLNHNVTGYRAPELLNTHKLTFESDVYSFGVLLVELLTGKNPNQASSSKEGRHFSKLVESVVCKEPEADIFDVRIKNDHNIEDMFQLLRISKSCVLTVPDQRPTMHDVVNMMDNMWLRPSSSSDDHSKGYDDTPSTDVQDTPSTITP